MLCSKCGQEIPKGKQFCSNCGYELKIKQEYTINIVITIILSALLCMITNFINLNGQIWLFAYCFLVIPCFLFAIIISYKNIYRNNFTSKPIIKSIIAAFVISTLFYCLIIFVGNNVKDLSYYIYTNFRVMTDYNKFFDTLSKLLILPNIILAFLVSFKRQEIKLFIKNNSKAKE